MPEIELVYLSHLNSTYYHFSVKVSYLFKSKILCVPCPPQMNKFLFLEIVAAALVLISGFQIKLSG